MVFLFHLHLETYDDARKKLKYFEENSEAPGTTPPKRSRQKPARLRDGEEGDTEDADYEEQRQVKKKQPIKRKVPSGNESVFVISCSNH